jgi:hypothetical protein
VFGDLEEKVTKYKVSALNCCNLAGSELTVAF